MSLIVVCPLPPLGGFVRSRRRLLGCLTIARAIARLNARGRRRLVTGARGPRDRPLCVFV